MINMTWAPYDPNNPTWDWFEKKTGQDASMFSTFAAIATIVFLADFVGKRV